MHKTTFLTKLQPNSNKKQSLFIDLLIEIFMLQEKVNSLLAEVEKFEIQSIEQLETFRLDFIS